MINCIYCYCLSDCFLCVLNKTNKKIPTQLAYYLRPLLDCLQNTIRMAFCRRGIMCGIGYFVNMPVCLTWLSVITYLLFPFNTEPRTKKKCQIHKIRMPEMRLFYINRQMTDLIFLNIWFPGHFFLLTGGQHIFFSLYNK